MAVATAVEADRFMVQRSRGRRCARDRSRGLPSQGTVAAAPFQVMQEEGDLVLVATPCPRHPPTPGRPARFSLLPAVHGANRGSDFGEGEAGEQASDQSCRRAVHAVSWLTLAGVGTTLSTNLQLFEGTACV